MTDALDPEIKRLHKLKPGELADEAGRLKAQISDLQDKLGLCRDEAVRRELREAEGDLFRLVMSPPGEQHRLDRDRLEKAFGAGFLEVFSFTVETGWQMRVNARKARRDRHGEPVSEAA